MIQWCMPNIGSEAYYRVLQLHCHIWRVQVWRLCLYFYTYNRMTYFCTDTDHSLCIRICAAQRTDIAAENYQ